MRSGALRIWTLLLIFGLALVLLACGSMGGNDDGDDEKFPEPPDRPSSAHVVAPMSHSVGDVNARLGDRAAPILRFTQSTSS